ncbi:MAG: M48 family metalloprotease [Bdellovibrionota bacterium]
MLPFSREHESEADEIGLRYMAEAGYDPREAPRFWGRFASEGAPPEFLSTHPNSSRRQRDLERDLPKVMPLYERSPQYGLGERL